VNEWLVSKNTEKKKYYMENKKEALEEPLFLSGAPGRAQVNFFQGLLRMFSERRFIFR